MATSRLAQVVTAYTALELKALLDSLTLVNLHPSYVQPDEAIYSIAPARSTYSCVFNYCCIPKNSVRYSNSKASARKNNALASCSGRPHFPVDMPLQVSKSGSSLNIPGRGQQPY